MKGLFPSGCACALLLASLAFAGCRTHHAAHDTVRAESSWLTPKMFIEIDGGVHTLMHDVANDVTQDGPTAWRKYFADTPGFFMAVNGKLVFANSAEAAAGIQQAATAIKQIDLKWGDDLRIDPLAPDIAAVAAPYHEIQAWADGRRVEDNGYFTGVVQYRDSRWQFRDCHWSEPVPPRAAP